MPTRNRGYDEKGHFCERGVQALWGEEYIFIQWKNGDYIYGGEEPYWYVFRKGLANSPPFCYNNYAFYAYAFSWGKYRNKEILIMKKSKSAKLFTIALTAVLLMSGCGQKDAVTTSQKDSAVQTSGEEQENSASQDSTDNTQLLAGKHHVNIIIKDKGTISVELDADAAPITVTNFVNLAKEGFYDGVVFHRIIENFMMQGGDPTGTGSGGSDTTIKGEFSANGVENSLSHTRGAVSMARSRENDSASSQFFIVHEDSTYLDGQYACFGYVTEGMDIVDDICENTEGGDYNGIIPEANRPVIETIEVVD